ncbi:serine-threonine kinase receptor-associated protein-like [Drosophila pseudoobscura]|uniref:Serine-threonine kinase receptor-associated protein n=1 Tax=Drosophila pseudoobscura pseudoobscura TaxID=46245 RepID=A0A6I8W021_DROPS|nr:serine-threonine kinase receptor-associated protein-like [Drosophila pseudoobscura]
MKLHFEGHLDGVLDFSFSKVCLGDGGYYLASVAQDGRGFVRRGDTGEMCCNLVGHEGPVRAVSMGAKGTIVATGGDDGTARIWSVATGAELTMFRQDQKVSSVALDTRSEWMLTSSQERDSEVCLYDVTRGEQDKPLLCLYQKEGRAVRNVIFCRGDRSFLSSSYDRHIELWDILSGQRSHMISLPHHAKSMELCADGKTVTIAYGESIVLFDADTFNIIDHLKPPFKVTGASLHPQQQRFVCTSSYNEIYGCCSYTREFVKLHEAPELMGKQVNCIKYSPDGEVYASSWTNGQIILWQDYLNRKNRLMPC